jgi:alkylation response protein AidB-like acyl-CoA dehydrogenase
MMTQVVTPQQIESRLYALSKEVDEAHQGLVDTEREFHQTTAEYEIAMARTRISLASKSSPTGKNYTVGEREDMAIIENADQHFNMATMEAQVKAARANVQRLKTQVEIARSMSASVRSSMELS